MHSGSAESCVALYCPALYCIVSSACSIVIATYIIPAARGTIVVEESSTRSLAQESQACSHLCIAALQWHLHLSKCLVCGQIAKWVRWWRLVQLCRLQSSSASVSLQCHQPALQMSSPEAAACLNQLKGSSFSGHAFMSNCSGSGLLPITAGWLLHGGNDED